MNYFRVGPAPLLAVLVLCSLSFNKKEQPLSKTATLTSTAPPQSSANALTEQTTTVRLNVE